MRAMICWTGISGYLAACWRMLAKTEGIDLKIISGTQGGIYAPFDVQLTAGVNFHLLSESQYHDVSHVTHLVSEHKPEVVVFSGWTNPAYVQLPFVPELAKAKFIMAMDTPWRHTWRQRMARMKIRRLLKRLDGIVVPGERAWQFANRLGMSEDRIFRGVYGIDADALQNLHAQRLQNGAAWPKRFLYVGRYMPVKALDILADAYRLYRAGRGDAWPLTCCGMGPDQHFLKAEGIEDIGFIQPPQQPEVWRSAGVFVIASRFDPWPLVVVEAAAAALPIVCTESCGSSVELVRPYYNGLTVGTDQVQSLARAMGWMHEHYADLPEMGRRSMGFAAAYSSKIWAQRWFNMLRNVVGA